MYISYKTRIKPRFCLTVICKCWCGCRELTKPNNRYVNGHDNRKELPPLKLCDCGCGKYTNYRKGKPQKYLIGHNSRTSNNFLKVDKSKPNSGQFQKEHIPWNKDTQGLIVAWNKDLTKDNDSRIKAYERTPEIRKKNKQANLGRKHSANARNNIANGARQRYKNCNPKPEKHILTKEERFVIWSKASKKKWEDPVFQDKMIQAGKFKQSKEEIAFGKFLEEHFGDHFQYVGDGKIFIARAVPDFINIEKRQIIEYNGCYIHGCVQCGFENSLIAKGLQVPEERIAYFAKYNWDAIVVWSHEMKYSNTLYARISEWLKF